MPTPGIGDPHWYEWYVGLKFVIEMINPDHEISSVIFQHSKYDTIDDVVVEYDNGNKQVCYQVKHQIKTTENGNMTFGSLLEGKQDSLFRALFNGWEKAHENATDIMIEPILFTNRRITGRKSSRSYSGEKYLAYSVNEFLKLMKIEIEKNPKYDNFTIEDLELATQWKDFKESFSNIDEKRVLDFLKAFRIEGNQSGLKETHDNLILELKEVFSCDISIAEEMFDRLVGRGLTEWTTAERKSEKVRREDVYTVLGVTNEEEDSQHRLVPPSPFFESRKVFCNKIEERLRRTTKKFVFISGNPGSGKTSIVSYLQAETDLFFLRYHTFRPISPEQHFYNTDSGMYSPENLWGTLLFQLRNKLQGRLAKYKVPLNNKLISVEEMRAAVLRLLGIIGEEEAKRIYVCIDGIDHAARAKNKVTFLSTLPLPDEIPDNVCIVVVGQPSNLYQEEYPIWISDKRISEQIDMPKLYVSDVEQLIFDETEKFTDVAHRLAELIFEKTDGNNLSVVYAVKEISKLDCIEDAINQINNSGITYDVHQYYFHLWKYVKEVLKDNVSNVFEVDIVVASSILLMDGKINIRIMGRALSQYGLNATNLKMIMERLFPVIVEGKNEEEYTLFHNDFRVFLMGLIQTYESTQRLYKQIAYKLAKDLFENEEGLITCVKAIPLLKSAGREGCIPRYFTTEFVIDALAEGVSKERLDEFVHWAYEAACENRNVDEYCSVYLAIRTLYQHENYFESCDREYKCKDYPRISSIDIDEIRSLPISENNFNEYQKVLDLVLDLYRSDLPNGKYRALNLYRRWFENLSPVNFRNIYKKIDDVYVKIDFSVKEFLKQWGRVAAELDQPLKAMSGERLEDDRIAISIFGNAYFKRCIECEKYEQALESLKSRSITYDAVSDELKTIYYCGNADKFKVVLEKMKNAPQVDTLNRLLAFAMEITCNFEAKGDFERFEDEKDCVLPDEKNLSMVLRAFIAGHFYREMEEEDLIDQVKAYYYEEDQKEEVEYLAEISALVGKYFWKNNNISVWAREAFACFLEYEITDFHNYRGAYRFLLHTLLSSKFADTLSGDLQFMAALQCNLMNPKKIGSYYNVFILAFLKRNNRLEIIREYIVKLYGRDLSKICLLDNDKMEIHRYYQKYGTLVEPELMDKCSDQFKWDVVGYTGHKEQSIKGPYDYCKRIFEIDPTRWQDLGIKLYRQSQIADRVSNEYSEEVETSLINASVICGIEDFWMLHLFDEQFQLNPQRLYQALIGFIHQAKNVDELKIIWIVNCGIHSWYTRSEHGRAERIYDECSQKAKSLNVDFSQIALRITPEWKKIIEHHKNDERYHDIYERYNSDSKISRIRGEYDNEDKFKILEELSNAPDLDYYIERCKVLIELLESEGPIKKETARQILEISSKELKEHEWYYEEYEFVIRKMIQNLGEEALWKFADTIETQLSEYKYQTSTRNMHTLIEMLFYDDVRNLEKIFNNEIKTQRLWISGNRHIKVNEDVEAHQKSFVQPKSLLELGMYLLLEQADIDNVRKTEAAILGLYLLGKHYPEIIAKIEKQWEEYSDTQKMCFLYVIPRWVDEGITEEIGISILFNEFKVSKRLSIKYYLHSFLTRYKPEMVKEEKISCWAEEDIYELPTMGEEGKLAEFEDFFRLVEEHNYEDVRAIRRYVYSIQEQLKVESRDPYIGRSDMIGSIIKNEDIDKILYTFEKNNKFSGCSFDEKKAYLLRLDGPWLLTSLPTMVFDEKLFPEGLYASQEKAVIENTLEQITNSYLREDETVLLADLWYPYQHKDGVRYILTTKILDRNKNEESFMPDYCRGNYEILICNDCVRETENSFVDAGGRCLFNFLKGSVGITYATSQFAPSSIWKKIFECHPNSNNPYIWQDKDENEVLRFERIASPVRDLMREPYIRQPIMFRWVCKTKWLELITERLNVKIFKVSKMEAYPTIGDL